MVHYRSKWKEEHVSLVLLPLALECGRRERTAADHSQPIAAACEPAAALLLACHPSGDPAWPRHVFSIPPFPSLSCPLQIVFLVLGGWGVGIWGAMKVSWLAAATR